MDIGRLIATEDRAQIERWCRQQTQQAYLGDHHVLCRILGKLFCYVDGRDTALAPYLMLDGFWEMWISQAVCRYVKPKMTCVDVGASFGYYTLLLADLVGERGKVWSFEPEPESFLLLQDSVAVNGFGHRTVTARQAVGAMCGTVSLVKPGSRWSDTRVAPASDVSDLLDKVVLTTLDTLLPEETKIDFIKVDAEGSELEIWYGMQGVLNRDNPVVLMEFSPFHLGGTSAEKLLDEIQKAGFVLRHVAHTGNPEPITATQLMAGGVDMLWLDRR